MFNALVAMYFRVKGESSDGCSDARLEFTNAIRKAHGMKSSEQMDALKAKICEIEGVLAEIDTYDHKIESLTKETNELDDNIAAVTGKHETAKVGFLHWTCL